MKGVPHPISANGNHLGSLDLDYCQNHRSLSVLLDCIWGHFFAFFALQQRRFTQFREDFAYLFPLRLGIFA